MCFIFSCCLPRQERESADEPVAEAVRRVSASIDDVEDAGDASSTKVKSVEVSVSQKDVGDGHSVIETWQEEEENVALVGESSVSVREGQSSHWWIKKSVMPWKGLNKSHKTSQFFLWSFLTCFVIHVKSEKLTLER